MKQKGVWLRRIILAMATIGLFWLLSEIGWIKILSLLQQIGWRGAVSLLVLGALESAADALALREATLGRIGFRQVLSVNQAGTLLNMIIPAEAGEWLKAGLLSDHTPGRAASATLIWNVSFRFTKPLVIALAALIAGVLLPVWRGLALLMIGLCGLRLATYLILRITLQKGWIGKVSSLLTRLRWFRGDRAASFVNRIRDVEQSAAQFWHFHRSHSLKMTAYQVAARGASFLSVWVILIFLEVPSSFAFSTLIFAGTQLIGYLLALLPTRIGTSEGSSYLFFSFLALDGGLGVVYEVIMRLKQLVVHSACLPGLARAIRSRSY